MVDAFDEFFQSFYLMHDNDNHIVNDDYVNLVYNSIFHINFLPIDETELLLAIKRLKYIMTSDPDNIQSFLVKDWRIPLCTNNFFQCH